MNGMNAFANGDAAWHREHRGLALPCAADDRDKLERVVAQQRAIIELQKASIQELGKEILELKELLRSK